ncbi:hypothetical protein A1353_21620 [Methylomonas methanica]|uniref:Uncharacterized protein n=1 Tax=Methylomonas methanica TaxID=421 RepID=A0A177LZT8_METMH|nr:hypothetical protein [Methylomonas methanica]OAH98975.1 hypothetical protein A1353_21620 [Methylomonas methanica]
MDSTTVYALYLGELRTSIGRSLRKGQSRPENEAAFKIFVPLWLLLNGLRDGTNSPNPTKEMLLSYLREAGDFEGFLKVAKDHHVERNFGSELQRAHEAFLFASYFDELISDSLLFVNAFHLSNYRGCVIALRCMLEDMYRHLYYKDNREYFIRVHNNGESEHSLKLAPASFREYLSKASYLKILSSVKESFTVPPSKTVEGFLKLNEELYSRTSSFVHGAAPRTLNGFESNLDLIFDSARADEVLKLANLVAMLIVVFLCCGHLDQFAGLNESVKREVFKVFPGSLHARLRQTLRV